jgi:hypothetical protein
MFCLLTVVQASYLAGSLSQLVRDVGAEGTALLYAAMLLKKRIAIYSPNLVRFSSFFLSFADALRWR